MEASVSGKGDGGRLYLGDRRQHIAEAQCYGCGGCWLAVFMMPVDPRGFECPWCGEVRSDLLEPPREMTAANR